MMRREFPHTTDCIVRRVQAIGGRRMLIAVDIYPQEGISHGRTCPLVVELVGVVLAVTLCRCTMSDLEQQKPDKVKRGYRAW